MTIKNASCIAPIVMTHEGLKLLDQRCLPRAERYLRCRTASDVARAIRNMTVRGAPAIGVAAAYGMTLAARQERPGDRAAMLRRLERAAAVLTSARPTAVNLAWAVSRMTQRATRTCGTPREIRAALEEEAHAIHAEDVRANMTIGARGHRLLPATGTILTHCNAGALATAGYGTALGVIRAASAAGKRLRVIADETRPFLQGARLTAWELLKDGIDVTLVADGAAGHLMACGEVDAVIVGADRIAMNGDVANKIGTYTLACLASRHRIPFYVAAPVSTVDPKTLTGKDIRIEERPEAEVLHLDGRRIAPAGARARNPAFDVTPARLVTAIVTEQGILRPPYRESLLALRFRRA